MSSKIKVKVEGEQNGADCRDLCRLCLAKCSDGELIDIFDYNTETSISLRIMACAGFEVSDFQLIVMFVYILLLTITLCDPGHPT